MARHTLSRRAALDLIEIERYSIERWGKKTGAGSLLEIEDALRLPKDHPGLLREKTEVSESLKFYRVGQHFIVCAVEAENIYVLTVKRGAMDLPERIREIEPSLRKESQILHHAFSTALGQWVLARHKSARTQIHRFCRRPRRGDPPRRVDPAGAFHHLRVHLAVAPDFGHRLGTQIRIRQGAVVAAVRCLASGAGRRRARSGWIADLFHRSETKGLPKTTRSPCWGFRSRKTSFQRPEQPALSLAQAMVAPAAVPMPAISKSTMPL